MKSVSLKQNTNRHQHQVVNSTGQGNKRRWDDMNQQKHPYLFKPIYTWNPDDLYVWRSTPPKQGLFQSKQGSFGFQVAITVYLYSWISILFHQNELLQGAGVAGSRMSSKIGADVLLNTSEQIFFNKSHIPKSCWTINEQQKRNAASK